MIYIDNIDISKKYGLICTRYDFGLAAVNTPSPITIPGRSGSIDLTDITGITYSDREFTAEFVHVGNFDTYEEIKSQIQNDLEGKKVKISDSNNEGFYIIGRISMEAEIKNIRTHSINFVAVCEPWRYKTEETVHTVSAGTSDYSLDNLFKSTIPTFFTEDEGIEIEINGTRYSIPRNIKDYKNYEIVLQSGSTPISVYGTGNLQIKYREGKL